MKIHLARRKLLHLLLILIVGLLSSYYGRAQTVVDAVAKLYHNAAAGSEEQLLQSGKYAQALFFNNRKEEAMDLLKKDIAVARKKKDGQYAAYLYGIMAMNNLVLEDSTSAFNNLRQARVFSEKTKDNVTKGYVLYCEGWMWLRYGKEMTAIESFQKALNYYDKAPETDLVISRKTAIYKELCSVYANWRAYEQQQKYAELTLQMAKVKNNPMDIFDAYMIMGYMYEEQYRINITELSLRNKAEHYYQQAIKAYQNNKDKMAIPSDLSFAAVNLANLYLQYYPQNDQQKGLGYADLALEVATETRQMSQVAAAYGIKADYSIKTNKNEDAEKYLLAALAALINNPMEDKGVSLSLFAKLSELYENENNYEKALHYYKQYVKVFEEVYNARKLEQAQRLEAQFEKERQKQALIHMQLEAEKREQTISLMHALSGQQFQQLENMKLNEQNQKQVLEVIQLEADKRGQELKLARLEMQKRAQELKISQQNLAYKSKTNTYYFLLACAFFLSAIFLYYAYRQREKTLRQKENLHLLEIDQIKQNSEISNLKAMLEGQESERTRLARDLHDGLGGLLSGTRIELSQLSEKVTDKPLEKNISRSLSHLDIAVDELRRIAHNLMPELLLKYGLEETLKEYVRRMSHEEMEVTVQFINYSGQLPAEKQIIVYRIIQELVNNAIKHAVAHQIYIQLSENESRMFITVEDDGIGFDPVKLNGQRSAGMHNIQSRLDFLKGTMYIDSQNGIGTTIELDFPL